MTFDELQKNDGKVQNTNIDFDKYGVWVKKPPRTVQSDAGDQTTQEFHEEFADDILTPDEQNYLNTPLHQETDISQSDDENEIPCFTQLTEDSSILDVPDFNSTITSNKKNSSISEITGYEDTAFLQPEQDADEDTAFLQPEQDAAGDNDIPTFLTETAGTTDTAESAGSDGTVTDTDFTFEDFTDLTDLPETDDNEMSIAAEEPAMQPEQTAATLPSSYRRKLMPVIQRHGTRIPHSFSRNRMLPVTAIFPLS